MIEWKETAIKDFGRVITGYTPPTNNLILWEGITPFYSPSDFDENIYCPETERTVSKLAITNDRIVQTDSLMVTCIASIGKIALARKMGISNQQINTIIFNDLFDPRYCYYLVKFNIDKLLKLAGTTAVPIVNKTEFEKIILRHHTRLSTQRRIARILNTCDGVIEKTEAAVAKYLAIKQGLLHDLFTRGIDPATGQLRPAPAEAPELYQETALGWVPLAWEVARLEEVTDKIGSGVTPTGGSEVYQSSGVLFIRSQNVLVGSLSIEDAAFITSEVDERMEGSRVKPFDVLLNITGASIGRCSYFPKELKSANVNQHVCIIRFTESSESMAIFASEFLNSSFGQDQINRSNAGGNREGLNFQQIKSFYFPIIKLNEVESITRVIQSQTKKLQSEQSYLDKLKQIKSGLMEDLLSGHKRVPAFEEAASPQPAGTARRAANGQ